MTSRLTIALFVLFAFMSTASACLVKDPSGALKVRNAPNGLVVGTLKNGTLVIIEETRGDWVSVTTYTKRSATPVWVRYSELDCDFVDDVYKKAERAGKTLEQFADEILRDVRPTAARTGSSETSPTRPPPPWL